NWDVRPLVGVEPPLYVLVQLAQGLAVRSLPLGTGDVFAVSGVSGQDIRRFSRRDPACGAGFRRMPFRSEPAASSFAGRATRQGCSRRTGTGESARPVAVATSQGLSRRDVDHTDE